MNNVKPSLDHLRKRVTNSLRLRERLRRVKFLLLSFGVIFFFLGILLPFIPELRFFSLGFICLFPPALLIALLRVKVDTVHTAQWIDEQLSLKTRVETLGSLSSDDCVSEFIRSQVEEILDGSEEEILPPLFPGKSLVSFVGACILLFLGLLLMVRCFFSSMEMVLPEPFTTIDEVLSQEDISPELREELEELRRIWSEPDSTREEKFTQLNAVQSVLESGQADSAREVVAESHTPESRKDNSPSDSESAPDSTPTPSASPSPSESPSPSKARNEEKEEKEDPSSETSQEQSESESEGGGEGKGEEGESGNEGGEQGESESSDGESGEGQGSGKSESEAQNSESPGEGGAEGDNSNSKEGGSKEESPPSEEQESGKDGSSGGKEEDSKGEQGEKDGTSGQKGLKKSLSDLRKSLESGDNQSETSSGEQGGQGPSASDESKKNESPPSPESEAPSDSSAEENEPNTSPEEQKPGETKKEGKGQEKKPGTPESDTAGAGMSFGESDAKQLKLGDSGEEAPGLGGDAEFEEVRVGEKDEKFNAEHTGDTERYESGEAGGEYATSRESRVMEKAETRENRYKKMIPLEYRDVLQ